MQRHLPVLILAVLVIPLVLLGCTTTPETTAPPSEEPAVQSPAEDAADGAADAATLIEERCTGCHDVGRIKTAEHDEAGWESTVSRMRSAGAELTDEEAQSVIDFLVGGGASDL